MIGRRDGALMRSSSTYTISRANLIIAVAIGMLIGCVLAYFAPSGLLIPISSHVRTVESSGSDSQAVSAKCEPSERLSALKSEFAAASEKNSELRKKIRELKEKLILAEQRKDNVQKQVLVLGEQQKVGPFGTVKALRTNPTIAPDVSVNPRLAKIMEKVAVNREVIVTLAHSNVKDMLGVWVSSVKRVGITNYLVVTLDEEIAKFCESSNVTVYVTTGRTRHNPAVSALKFQILRELMQMGYSVLFSEVDIVYLQNPFEHLCRDSDVESMSDGFDHMTAYGFDDVFDEPAMGWARYAHTMRIWVYNSGFFYIRPTVPSVELLDRVATRLQWVPTSWDQPIMNEELFFPSHPGYDGLHASGRTMDFYLFMNSKVLFTHVRKDATLKKSTKPVVIRVNYHPDKLPRMKAIVEFYVNSKLDALDNFPDGSN